MTEQERMREYRDILILLLKGLGMSRPRIMITMAIIRAHKIEREMINFIATYRGKETTFTTQIFMSKLSQLTDGEKE